MGNLYLDGKPGRTCTIDGREFLFFSGYNYLGINEDAEFNGLVAAGAAKYGWVFPSSRISNTRLGIFEECEALLSSITNTEDTVLLPSGYAAGRMATSYFKTTVHNAPGSHPAILQHRSGSIDFGEWKEWLINAYVPQEKADPLVLASDSVSPLTASANDFSFLGRLPRATVVVIDDSHGIGILGENGKGVSSALPVTPDIEYMLTYSLAKAFGISGGAVSCSSGRARFFRSLPEYTSVTPVSPAQVYAFINGQHIYQRQREKLISNMAYFKSCIKGLKGISFVDGFPVFILPAAIHETDFYRQGILVSSFSYPDPAGQKLNRIVINALHTKNDLDRLADAMRAISPFCS
jgi:8-amino-7-oxononanoate synthase